MTIDHKATCIARIFGARMGGHDCPNRAVTASGHCKVHDPKLKAQREASVPKCAYVDEQTGKPDCEVTVRDGKYCSFHGRCVSEGRTGARARAQMTTLDWLNSLDCELVNIDEVIARLSVTMRNL